MSQPKVSIVATPRQIVFLHFFICFTPYKLVGTHIKLKMSVSSMIIKVFIILVDLKLKISKKITKNICDFKHIDFLKY